MKFYLKESVFNDKFFEYRDSEGLIHETYLTESESYGSLKNLEVIVSVLTATFKELYYYEALVKTDLQQDEHGDFVILEKNNGKEL